MSHILIIGGSGFIGARLVAAILALRQSVAYTYRTAPLHLSAPSYHLDLSQPAADSALRHILQHSQPDILVYCAVPLANQPPGIHQAVSVDGVARCLEALTPIRPDARFIYLSTNAVFAGGNGPYREQHVPDAHQRRDHYRVYGETRAAGEAIAQTWPAQLVIRTATVDGASDTGALSSRLANLVQVLQTEPTVARFCDRYLSPTLVDNLVAALVEICSPTFGYTGTLHIAGSERVTDYDYARRLCRYLGLDPAAVRPVSMEIEPMMRNSPRDISLDIEFTQSLLNTKLLDLDAQFETLFGTG